MRARLNACSGLVREHGIPRFATEVHRPSKRFAQPRRDSATRSEFSQIPSAAGERGCLAQTSCCWKSVCISAHMRFPELIVAYIEHQQGGVAAIVCEFCPTLAEGIQRHEHFCDASYLVSLFDVKSIRVCDAYWFPSANDLDCGRSPRRRKAVHCAGR